MSAPTPGGSRSLRRETFTGFRRGDGRIGVRNRVLVVPSVICSHIVAERITKASERAVCTPHDHGCAQIGADHEQTERTLLNLARNPNIAGTTVVGLGCEYLQSGPFADRIAAEGIPVRETTIQDAGGSDACIEEGIDATRELTRTALTDDRTDATLDDLTVGIVSSDLDRSTREIADPVVGETVDALLDAGARVVVAGTERLAAHPDAAAARGATDAIAEKIRASCERDAAQPGSAQRVVRHAADAEFESVVGTWGSARVDEFVRYGGRATLDEGLALIDSPSRFEEATTALAADIDIDARTAESAEVLNELVRVANGGSTAAEEHGLIKFAINRVGPSL